MGIQFEGGGRPWIGVQQVSGEGSFTISMGVSSFWGNLMVENGVPFPVSIDFQAGWRMTNSEIASILGASFTTFSTNAVWDASHTASLDGVALRDTNGTSYAIWSLTDSTGASITPSITPVPEPASTGLLAAGALLVAVIVRRFRHHARG
jgi:hypothetical protein